MRIGFFWLGCSFVALSMAAGPARAQQWLADRQRAEGHGVLLGTLELHPGIGTEIGYDSNVFLAAPDEDPESSAVLRVAPSLYISTLGAERLQNEEPTVSFRAGANGSLRHYFATDLPTNMGVGEDAKLTWRPSQIFQLELFQDYKRSIAPFGQPTDPLSLDPDSDELGTDFDRNQLGGGTRLQLSTPGALLKGGLGYRIDWDSFEDTGFDANDSFTHTIAADTSWEFLPKTAIFWNGSAARHLYSDEDATALGERNDGTLVSNKLGLNGALTSRISFTIAGGYDAQFVDGDESENEAITAQVEARWRFIETAQWSLGYDRTLRPSFQGNAMRTDRIKTELQSLFWGTTIIGAKAELAFINFGEDEFLGDRKDTQLVLNLNGEYRFVDWFAMTAEVGYLRNFTDFVVEIEDPAGGTIPDEAKYQRFEAWLGVRAFL